MSSVIVGIGTETGDATPIRWARPYAAAVGAELVVVVAWEPDQAELPPDRFEALEAEVRARAEQLVGEVVAGAGGNDQPVELLVREGSPADSLAAVAEDRGAELVVIGHPRGFAPRWTSEVVRFANGGPVPVVVAQGEDPDPVGRPVVAAIDGADADPSVLAWASEVARALGGAVRPVAAVPLEPVTGRGAGRRRAVALDGLESELGELATRDERIPAGLDLVVIEEGPIEALLELASSARPALIVTGRGRGPLLDAVPAGLVEDGSVSVGIVPSELPPGWHEAHGDGRIPGEGEHDRWHDLLGWLDGVLHPSGLDPQ